MYTKPGTSRFLPSRHQGVEVVMNRTEALAVIDDLARLREIDDRFSRPSGLLLALLEELYGPSSLSGGAK